MCKLCNSREIHSLDTCSISFILRHLTPHNIYQSRNNLAVRKKDETILSYAVRALHVYLSEHLLL